MPLLILSFLIAWLLPTLGYFKPVLNDHHRSAGPPNFLLITADDLGLQVGCYGDKTARTPHLDQLAREGMKFTNAYVAQASCSPSRSAMLTGLYPHQNGQIGLANRGFSMHDSIVTLPAMLKKAGYRTGIIGKLHVKPEKNFPFDAQILMNEARETRKVQMVADKAAEFIGNSDQPFFLMVNYFDPHVEFVPQVEGLPRHPYKPDQIEPLPFQMIDTPKQRERIADFYSCISRLDTGLGMLMEALKKSGKAGNTLVIYIGDHGAPFTRGKTSCYEAGLKIPFLVRWPGQVPAGRAEKNFVSTVDIVPTILEAAGTTSAQKVTGLSLSPLFRGKTKGWRQYLFGEFQYHGDGEAAHFPRFSVRDDRYKLIVNVFDKKTNPIPSIDGDKAYQMSRQPEYEGTLVREIFDRYMNPPKYELFDLQKDPHEFHNLADQPKYAAKLKELQTSLKDWMRRTDAPFGESIK